MEELIDHIIFDPGRARQELSKEHLGEYRLVMKHAKNRVLLDPHDLALRQRRGARHAPGLCGQASFAAKFIGPEDCNHGLLAVLGNDGELDLAFLDVKNAIRDVPLREDFLILAIYGNHSSLANFGKEFFWLKSPFGVPQKGSL